MADDLEKTAHADGATVEPPHHVLLRRRRRGYRFSKGCECCCGLGCLRLLVVVIIAAAIVLTGLIIAIFCIIINPQVLKFHVTDASLSKFNYITTNKTLDFKLLLNVTVRNPNKRIGIHIEFSPDYYAYYGGESLGGGIGQLGWGLSYLPPGAGSAAHEKGWLLFQGRRTVSFGSRAVKRLNKRKSDGVIPFVVKIRMINSFKVDKMHIGDFRDTIKCRVYVPLISASTTNRKSGLNSTIIGFKNTKCNFYFNPIPVFYAE